jgi:FdhD protein
MKTTSHSIHYFQFRADRQELIEGGVIVETPVSLTVNGEIWLTFMCTPCELEAMAAGFLFNEGVIQSKDEILDIRVCASQDNVDVWLDHQVEKPKNWKRTSGCSGGVTASDWQTMVSAQINRVHINGITIDAQSIGKMIEKLFDSQDLYRKVGGVHTSALSDGESIRVVAEDIGRHNSLDKLAGICLLRGIHLEKKVLITTGRISSEMMQKSARLGASVVISRTSPSSLSIEIAEKLGITLIGYARRDRFNVYTHPDRILSFRTHENWQKVEYSQPQNG